jgi:tetratricopeptide (TPR) repeat protein
VTSVAFAAQARAQRAPEIRFQEAVALNRRGRLHEAERRFEELLTASYRAFDCLCAMGLINLQQQKFETAAALFARALRLDKRGAETHHYLAASLTGAGRYAEAARHYEKAVAIRPRFAEAHSNYGYLLQLLGRHRDAAEQCRKALAIRPDYVEARNNLGNALQALDRSEEAVAEYQRAVDLRPDYAEAHSNLAAALAAVGATEAALRHARLALSQQPRFAPALVNAGDCLQALGQSEHAVQHYAAALEIAGNRPDVVIRLIQALLGLRRPEDAVAVGEKALASGCNEAQVHIALGKALVAMGRFDDARGQFERAIDTAPDQAVAYYNLAQVKSFDAGDPHFVKMRELADAGAHTPIAVRIPLNFALARAFADTRDYARSFACLREGNRMRRQQLKYDERATLGVFERVRQIFSSHLLQSKSGAGAPSRAPIFIVGMPRSGTTLVEQILASHPDVFAAGELPAMPRTVALVKRHAGEAFPEGVAGLGAGDLQAMGAAYLQEAARDAPATAARITDKLPGNLLYAGLIALALPAAKIIHVVRDPRDLAVSCFSTLFATGQEYTYDLAELGRYIAASQRLAAHWRQVLPDDMMLEVGYEDLVADTAAAARRLVAHCGLEWRDRCLEFYRTKRAIITASAVQVRQPIYTSSVGRWRDYGPFLAPLLAELT